MKNTFFAVYGAGASNRCSRQHACQCLSREGDADEVNNGMSQVTGCLVQRGLDVVETSEVDCLQTQQGCVNVMGAHRAIKPFS